MNRASYLLYLVLISVPTVLSATQAEPVQQVQAGFQPIGKQRLNGVGWVKKPMGALRRVGQKIFRVKTPAVQAKRPQEFNAQEALNAENPMPGRGFFSRFRRNKNLASQTPKLSRAERRVQQLEKRAAYRNQKAILAEKIAQNKKIKAYLIALMRSKSSLENELADTLETINQGLGQQYAVNLTQLAKIQTQ